jgi:predicted ATPase
VELIKLKVEGFKMVNEIELDLADVNILVGANGSGKSSVLQAVHLGCCLVRQADRVDPTKTNTVGIEQLDYLPTDDYKTLGHKNNWGNGAGSPSSKVSLTFKNAEAKEIEAHCVIRSARNAGISVSGSVPQEASSLLRQKKRFFSAYIPGISGVPNKEERRSRKVILRSCSFGDSNVILRNALLLLKEEDEQNIKKIETWLSGLVGQVVIKVSHDDAHDLHIRCSINFQGLERPIELAGTGFLQLIQIFCYVLLFNPGVLLIDEPDIHLHPNVQEKLAAVLADIARERSMKVVMTTHSPFIVRGAPSDARVYWLQEGAKNSLDRTAVELAIGWGAFGKKIVLVSEDSDLGFLRKLIAQWPEIDRNVAFYPGSGFKNLPTAQQAAELCSALGGKYKIVVHRDRDSLTDDETAKLVEAYEAEGVHLWLPAGSDVESYFCCPSFIELFVQCTSAEATGYVDAVLDKHPVPIREQFNKQRAAHNEELHKQGGSPTSDDVWASFQQRQLKGAKGKFVLGQLKTAIGSQKFSKEAILAAKLSGSVGLDLKHELEKALTS